MQTGITVDPVTRTAVAATGLLPAPTWKQAVRRDTGCRCPPDPSSYEIHAASAATYATNAGGLCCVKLRRHHPTLLGLQGGRPTALRCASGPAPEGHNRRARPNKLFVGSEGTLGVSSPVTLPAAPQTTSATVVATFDSVQAAAGSVVAITEFAVVPG